MQQHLPFTVLKPKTQKAFATVISYVDATAPTVYGIETVNFSTKYSFFMMLQQHLLFTVCATECEAAEEQSDDEAHTLQVPERSEGKTKGLYLLFTVLKRVIYITQEVKVFTLQQSLPFTVLKRINITVEYTHTIFRLQQYLPFTVLKHLTVSVAVSLIKCMLQQHLPFTVLKRNSHICHTETSEGCNSTYRLRYCNAVPFNLKS